MAAKKIRKKDKISAIVSVSLIFGVCTWLCLWAFSSTFTIKLESYKDIIAKKSERQQQLRSEQQSHSRLCDSLYIRIDRFDPGINASFEENDIKFLINNLKEMYEQHSWDKRYKIFYHVSVFYDMWFADKKILWSKKTNIRKFTENLEQCEMGLTKKEEELNKKNKK